ncbi:MAG: indolepyruvate ferredoxin oxidoreductase subunit alpha [Pseudomonadales bacterium]
MAERSFVREVASLRLGSGEAFSGENILAVAKALLECGVSYVGGYQGAPISHLMDVFADARPLLDELGVRFESSASEATAAAMLAASINYPMRGAVTWKSTVGTNVASDALANLASSGVTGGALIVLGEDYGEGASIMQERTHAFAMKSQIWLLDPRPEQAHIVRMVHHAFALSEASHSPVMLMMRIRACHMHGRFTARDNVPAPFRAADALGAPARDPGRIILPPSTFAQEQEKVHQRWPAAQAYVRSQQLNEVRPGDVRDIGIVVQGGLFNALSRALAALGLGDFYGNARIPVYVLNVTYPLLPDEFQAFARGKRALLIVEEGQPEFIEQAANQYLRQAGIDTAVIGKGVLPMAGEYTTQVIQSGVRQFVSTWCDGLAGNAVAGVNQFVPLRNLGLSRPLPARPSGLCTGCPERPLFASMKLLERQLGKTHVSADIGCNSFATLPPFHLGASIMGYGLGAASSAALADDAGHRAISLMGDGGFWHNGLTSGIANMAFNQTDGVTVIVDNGYSAATGGQDIPSSRGDVPHRGLKQSIERAVRGVGINWVRRVHTYDMQRTMAVLREALTTAYRGPKVIVAEGECQLNRQRRVRPQRDADLAAGKRTVVQRFGVDASTCTGDHSCIRLSGCPSLTIAPSTDPLRQRPIAQVDETCVGCGVCGSVAHAATLCPSFHRVDAVHHARGIERMWHRLGQGMVRWLLQRRQARA